MPDLPDIPDLPDVVQGDAAVAGAGYVAAAMENVVAQIDQRVAELQATQAQIERDTFQGQYRIVLDGDGAARAIEAVQIEMAQVLYWQQRNNPAAVNVVLRPAQRPQVQIFDTPDPVKASIKSRATLRMYLSEEQRATFDDKGYFDLTGSLGTRYRIIATNVVSGNVYWLDGDGDNMVAKGCYCAHPTAHDPRRRGHTIPYADHHLGQFLELSNDEPFWLSKANVFAGDYPPNYTGPKSGRPYCGCADCNALLNPRRWKL